MNLLGLMLAALCKNHRSLEGKCIAIDVRKLGFQQLLGKQYMLICETLSLLKVFLHLSGEWWKFLQLSM